MFFEYFWLSSIYKCIMKSLFSTFFFNNLYKYIKNLQGIKDQHICQWFHNMQIFQSWKQNKISRKYDTNLQVNIQIKNIIINGSEHYMIAGILFSCWNNDYGFTTWGCINVSDQDINHENKKIIQYWKDQTRLLQWPVKTSSMAKMQCWLVTIK